MATDTKDVSEIIAHKTSTTEKKQQEIVRIPLVPLYKKLNLFLKKYDIEEYLGTPLIPLNEFLKILKKSQMNQSSENTEKLNQIRFLKFLTNDNQIKMKITGDKVIEHHPLFLDISDEKMDVFLQFFNKHIKTNQTSFGTMTELFEDFRLTHNQLSPFIFFRNCRIFEHSFLLFCCLCCEVKIKNDQIFSFKFDFYETLFKVEDEDIVVYEFNDEYLPKIKEDPHQILNIPLEKIAKGESYKKILSSDNLTLKEFMMRELNIFCAEKPVDKKPEQVETIRIPVFELIANDLSLKKWFEDYYKKSFVVKTENVVIFALEENLREIMKTIHDNEVRLQRKTQELCDMRKKMIPNESREEANIFQKNDIFIAIKKHQKKIEEIQKRLDTLRMEQKRLDTLRMEQERLALNLRLFNLEQHYEQTAKEYDQKGALDLNGMSQYPKGLEFRPPTGPFTGEMPIDPDFPELYVKGAAKTKTEEISKFQILEKSWDDISEEVSDLMQTELSYN